LVSTASHPAHFDVLSVSYLRGLSLDEFANEYVGDFKKLVAGTIGRQPHEIMLKRQSQRPFKDALTLDDYEISNGVQLDLELDTGD
jgi:hypothetical protein